MRSDAPGFTTKLSPSSGAPCTTTSNVADHAPPYGECVPSNCPESCALIPPNTQIVVAMAMQNENSVFQALASVRVMSRKGGSASPSANRRTNMMSSMATMMVGNALSGCEIWMTFTHQGRMMLGTQKSTPYTVPKRLPTSFGERQLLPSAWKSCTTERQKNSIAKTINAVSVRSLSENLRLQYLREASMHPGTHLLSIQKAAYAILIMWLSRRTTTWATASKDSSTVTTYSLTAFFTFAASSNSASGCWSAPPSA
mmetsp:Transcript_20206/g.51401  ORF Transcript_20206/g.51401 Transcript_20206/m.51401 type:complete len:256 (-) Transcript_20206:804-1571(-)